VTVQVLEADLGEGVRGGFTLGLPDGHPWNLSTVVGEAADVAAHRADLAAWVGAPVVFVRQVHGRGVHVHDGPAPPVGETDPAPPVAADAVVTCGGAAAAVLVADCVPVLLADPGAGVVAAVHAGRRGVAAGVVPAAVEAMAGLGARELRAVVGPAICGACYEVPQALRDEVAAVLPAAASTTSWGTPALDLPGAVRAQLLAAGVSGVAVVGGCTLEDPRWFSHRGTAAGRPAGRFAAVVRAVGGRSGPVRADRD
jgi:hypothetical protein